MLRGHWKRLGLADGRAVGYGHSRRESDPKHAAALSRGGRVSAHHHFAAPVHVSVARHIEHRGEVNAYPFLVPGRTGNRPLIEEPVTLTEPRNKTATLWIRRNSAMPRRTPDGMGRRRRTRVLQASAVALVLVGCAAPAAADTVTALGSVVVTATRTPARSFNLPLSIGAVTREQIQQAQPMVNLSESINLIPGIDAQNRQDYPQGLRISSRGFGARTPFGVRGVRMLVDGMPVTMPDGSGFADVFDLGSAQRIEVMRGPFSALYGNASGGVLQVFTQNGPPRSTLTPNFWAGSYGSYRGGLKFGGQQGGFNSLLDLSHFRTDGYRDHSTTRQDRLYAKLRYEPAPSTPWTLLVDGLSQPNAQDPGGLTAQQVAQDPRQVVSSRLRFDARKTVRHRQAGLVVRRRFGAHDSVRLLGYAGERRVLQFLPFGGSFGLSSGGVVGLSNPFGGIDARWTHRGSVGGASLTWTVGASWNTLNERRRGWVNLFGELGALRRNEKDTVYDVSEYLQTELRLTRRWRIDAGVRHSFVKFRSRDDFITASNPNDSGSVAYTRTNPVVGVLYRIAPRTNVYANYGEGFETPTFAQLAYKPSGASGLNLTLKPASSRQYEVGVKSFPLLSTELKLALFQIDSQNEIIVASSSNGRTRYQNDGATNRKGLEFSIDSHLPHHLDAYLAFSYLNAEFQDGAIAGNRLPGTPAAKVYGELRWREPASGFYTSVEALTQSKVYVDDNNSAVAGGYFVTGWAAGFKQALSRLDLNEFVRVSNVFDRSYIGAVVIADRNKRYFEPAPGRNFIVGVTANYRF